MVRALTIRGEHCVVVVVAGVDGTVVVAPFQQNYDDHPL
jgi:hypothetical protein